MDKVTIETTTADYVNYRNWVEKQHFAMVNFGYQQNLRIMEKDEAVEILVKRNEELNKRCTDSARTINEIAESRTKLLAQIDELVVSLKHLSNTTNTTKKSFFSRLWSK